MSSNTPSQNPQPHIGATFFIPVQLFIPIFVPPEASRQTNSGTDEQQLPQAGQASPNVDLSAQFAFMNALFQHVAAQMAAQQQEPLKLRVKVGF